MNNKLFPNLKHLKITNKLDKPNVQLFHVFNYQNKSENKTVENIASLISNGLKSFHLSIRNMEYCDFIDNLDRQKYGETSSYRARLDPASIIRFVNAIIDNISIIKQNNTNNINNNDNNNNTNINIQDFILKLEIDVRNCGIATRTFNQHFASQLNSDTMKATMVDVMNRVGWIFFNLNTRFQKNVMFAFRIKFNIAGDTNAICKDYVSMLVNSIQGSTKNEMLFGSNVSRVVDVGINIKDKKCDSASYYGYPSQCVCLAVVFKNKDKGKLNYSAQNCHAHPKFEYQCCYCHQQCWMTV